ncbi:MAG: LysR family transcriptional regulator [Devosia sp.]|nr:LysR family transcriptional regulator [Devosia sp.]
MHDFDWSDLRAFLAVVRTGRLTVAAQRLQVDHSTLSRQIGRLEAVLKARLFDRRPSGYVLTNAGEWLVKQAEIIESVTIGIQSHLADRVLGLAGSVRVGAPEGFSSYFLAPRIGRFSSLHPELEIELIANPRVVSLSKREAEIAVTNFCPKEGRLYASKMTDYELGLYASRQYLAQHPPPLCREDLRAHTIIGYIPDILPTFAHAYLSEVGQALNPRIRISNILTQLSATLGGVGICVIPCFMASREPDLVRLLADEVRIFREFWLVIHSDLRDIARVRTTADFITQAVRDERRLFLPG